MKVSMPVKASRNLEKENFMQNSAINHAVGTILAESSLNWLKANNSKSLRLFKNQEKSEKVITGAAMRPFIVKYLSNQKEVIGPGIDLLEVL